ncbi:GAF domain-containing protein [Nannocystis bainbridge]|uniref:GAF domain-containing protein n=1 Tax=Nannocystis bainbridge TaxID=2995303 RepID=A0ABT5DU98_9BACT|nr:GAF domain-containing protein [Nannocystis bainbridge]MDC0715997.1 GAF domain-containing protein [Nannocystis bainbridge]
MHTFDLPAGADRAEIYTELIATAEALVAGEPDLVANLANLAACLKQLPGVSWAGFYRRVGDDLVLGPFQGKLACTRIGPGKGVCGTAAARREALVVADVAAFPGHIACDADSRSEVVVPIVRGAQVLGVIDLDSDRLDNFDARDAEHLTRLAALVAGLDWPA